MNIVVNSTPLINLAIINQLELFQKLFCNVIIAKEQNIPLVCIDEFAGDQYAKLLGLDVIGTLGILLLAKQNGFIAELKPLFQNLIYSNRHISKILCNQVFRKALESDI